MSMDPRIPGHPGPWSAPGQRAPATARLPGQTAVVTTLWVALIASAVAMSVLFTQLFGMALAQALHAEHPREDEIPIFWGLVAVCIVLAVAVGFAVVYRRWVAVIFALLLGCMGGIVAVGVWSNVHSIVAPEETHEPRPLPCQCSSGGTCDCPGG